MRRTIVTGEPLAADSTLINSIKGDGLAVDQRLQIYRNNYRETLTSSLEAYFPSVLTFVGEQFFKGAAKAFVQLHPPVEARLSVYGSAFGDFLREWEHAQTIPYIGDLADLDFRIARAQDASEGPGIDTVADALAAFHSGSLALQPYVFVVVSNWPVGSLWMAAAGHIPPEAVHLNAGGQNVLVIRSGGAVEMQMVDDISARLLTWLKEKPINNDANGLRLTSDQLKTAITDLAGRGAFSQSKNAMM